MSVVFILKRTKTQIQTWLKDFQLTVDGTPVDGLLVARPICLSTPIQPFHTLIWKCTGAVEDNCVSVST
jgi:hypothetical protein